ncbi:permease for cytosine/purines, uracil, thiamine, allantoin-domain-containing protein [Roridomyces roridus]|uniref:Permease for cytosine/purines, uracil, thiamine, allantoin-domain-containing protein n=1 Tax=Roridomyces roridus TaxID=1738132 RepID=A0AAD7C0N7_9AGAR|nr:permease for cytosine/purines, uracil, thiamine, allantoin-domain-containing protein [Roridomyces roridus]
MSKEDYSTDEKAHQDSAFVSPAWHRRLLTWGVEERGIRPVTLEERTDPQYSKIFFIWFTASTNLLPFSTGSLGPIAYGLGLRDSCLVILFFNLLCCIPPGYLSTWGPKLGLRQMVQARYSFGYFGVLGPVLLNLIGMTGFCILDCILGGQTLAAVADGNLSWSIGIVIIAVVSLLVSFCGWKILHWYERVAWIPVVIIFLIVVGLGGKDFRHIPPAEPATAPTIMSFSAVIAGFVLTWSPLASDFSCYMLPNAPSKRIFWYSYLGLVLPTIALQCFGALIGACLTNVPAWEAGYESGEVGGLLSAMLSPAKGFGKFLTVLLALSVMGNVAATFYSISLNMQILMPVLVVVPRYVFSILATAIVIPLSIVGAHSFYTTLSNFLGLIGYWASTYIAIVLEEHFIFRRGDFKRYNLEDWNTPSKLPTGLAAITAALCGIGIAIPSMAQVWYTGPIAETTGDIGFELAFVVATIVYPPLRLLELRIRKHL